MKRSLVIDAIAEKRSPTPSSSAAVPLRSALDVRREMARVYRDVKAEAIDSQQGSRLVYILSQIGRMIELHELESRLLALEAKKENRHA